MVGGESACNVTGGAVRLFSVCVSGGRKLDGGGGSLLACLWVRFKPTISLMHCFPGSSVVITRKSKGKARRARTAECMPSPSGGDEVCNVAPGIRVQADGQSPTLELHAHKTRGYKPGGWV